MFESLLKNQLQAWNILYFSGVGVLKYCRVLSLCVLFVFKYNAESIQQLHEIPVLVSRLLYFSILKPVPHVQ